MALIWKRQNTHLPSIHVPSQVLHDRLPASWVRVRGGDHLPRVWGHLLRSAQRLCTGTASKRMRTIVINNDDPIYHSHLNSLNYNLLISVTVCDTVLTNYCIHLNVYTPRQRSCSIHVSCDWLSLLSGRCLGLFSLWSRGGSPQIIIPFMGTSSCVRGCYWEYFSQVNCVCVYERERQRERERERDYIWLEILLTG